MKTEVVHPADPGELSVPMSKLEALLVKRLHWENYTLQYPLRETWIKVFTETKLLNLDTGKIEYLPQYHYKRPQGQMQKGVKLDIPAKDTHARTRLMATWHYSYKQYGFPPSFEKEFPYIYMILRDQFLANYIHAKNERIFEARYHETQTALARLITAFWGFYVLTTKLPGVVFYLKKHPEVMPMVKNFEDLIAELADPKDLE